MSMYKNVGLVSHVFTPETLSGLKGHYAIGHTRYSTTGSSHIRNAQRLVEQSVELRGAFAKLVQMLSMRNDLLPAEAVDVRASVRSALPPMPADVVRRWYAEELLALRERWLPKDAAFTPNEYVPTVAEAFPDCADAFRRLTRAYEDVRYGDHRIPAEVLHRLEDDHRSLLGALHRPA